MIQLLRECPPGFGGVERTAHELATQDQSTDSEVFCIANKLLEPDPLQVSYRRFFLPHLKLGRVRFLLPGFLFWRLLFSSKAVHAHLPSPEVLSLVVIMKIIQPNRCISIHWHAFLEGYLYGLYQFLALYLIRVCNLRVITTSPILSDLLLLRGLNKEWVHILPCCLSDKAELMAAQGRVVKRNSASTNLPIVSSTFRVVCIGRLDTYKRIDWVINALSLCGPGYLLSVVGVGPQRAYLENLAAKKLDSKDQYFFYGALCEEQKFDLLYSADLLVLAFNSSHEAFGIVQLEAMACGVPSLALHCKDSGASWVSNLASLPIWDDPSPDALAKIIMLLNFDRVKHQNACQEAFNKYQSQFNRNIWKLKCDFVFNSIISSV